jgi:hypothetical protein
MIAAIRKLVLGERRDNENLLFPYWVIVQPRWGNDILLAGVWFSREDAEHHLKCHGDVFGRRAVVRCMSAVRAESGLRKLYLHLMSEDVAPAPKSPPSRASYFRGSAGMNAAMNAAKQWRDDMHEGQAMVQRLEDALSMFRPSINETVEAINRMRAFLTQLNTPPDCPNVAPGGLKLGWTTYSDGETTATVALGARCSIRFTAMQGTDRRFWSVARFCGRTGGHTNAFDACGDTLLEAQQNAEAGLWEVFEPLLALHGAATKRGATLSNQIKLYATVAEGHAIIAERKRIAQVIRERNAAGQLRQNENLSVQGRSLLSQLADMIERGEL